MRLRRSRPLLSPHEVRDFLAERSGRELELVAFDEGEFVDEFGPWQEIWAPADREATLEFFLVRVYSRVDRLRRGGLVKPDGEVDERGIAWTQDERRAWTATKFYGNVELVYHLSTQGRDERLDELDDLPTELTAE